MSKIKLFKELKKEFEKECQNDNFMQGLKNYVNNLDKVIPEMTNES